MFHYNKKVNEIVPTKETVCTQTVFVVHAPVTVTGFTAASQSAMTVLVLVQVHLEVTIFLCCIYQICPSIEQQKI